MWLVGVVMRYIDILIIIINFPYSTCIRSFFASSILTSLFIFKMFFRSLYIQRSYRRAVLMQRLSQRRTVVMQVIQAYLNFNVTLYIHMNNHVHRAPLRHKKEKEIERETQQ